MIAQLSLIIFRCAPLSRGPFPYPTPSASSSSLLLRSQSLHLRCHKGGSLASEHVDHLARKVRAAHDTRPSTSLVQIKLTESHVGCVRILLLVQVTLRQWLSAFWATGLGVTQLNRKWPSRNPPGLSTCIVQIETNGPASLFLASNSAPSTTSSVGCQNQFVFHCTYINRRSKRFKLFC